MARKIEPEYGKGSDNRGRSKEERKRQQDGIERIFGEKLTWWQKELKEQEEQRNGK